MYPSRKGRVKVDFRQRGMKVEDPRYMQMTKIYCAACVTRDDRSLLQNIVSFIGLCWALLPKRPVILRSLLIVATPYM